MLALLLLSQTSLLARPQYHDVAPPETRSLRAIRLVHDQVPGAVGAPTLEAAQNTADTLYMELRSGTPFAELAGEASGHPSARFGGVLGTFARGMLAPELDGFLFSAEVGELSRPLPTEFGVFLLQRIERDAGCLTIFVEGVDAAAWGRARAVGERLAAGEGFAALARELSEDPLSAARGGQLGRWQRGPSDTLLKAEVFAAELGEVRGPIESPLGLHFVKRVAPEEIADDLAEDGWLRARAILIRYQGAAGAPAVERTNEEAGALARQLFERVRRGEDMAHLARQYSEDPGGAERAGDLGWLLRRATDMPAFMDRLFLDPVGEPIGPLSTSVGWVILRREDVPSHTRIDARISPLVDLEQWVRFLSEKSAGEPLPDVEGLAPAVAAARELTGLLNGGWFWLEGLLLYCDSAADFLERLAELPETRLTRDGSRVELRSVALRYGEALLALEPVYLEHVWPAHREVVELLLTRIQREFLRPQSRAFATLMEALGIPDPGLTVTVYPVCDAPWPGAVTYWAPMHRTPNPLQVVVLLGSRGLEGTQLHETLLHEATHALDLASRDEPTALNVLRERLEAAGLDARDRRLRDVPHTLMFVNAGETVRRMVDPAHEHYGDVAGYYPKVREVADAVRPAWTRFLDGESSRAEALDAILAALLGDH